MRIVAKIPEDSKKLHCFGGSALGNKYGVTERYLTKNGKPYICKMGEFHYSRIPEECWEQELLKMKDGGIDIISSYIIWIHHEETEGEFCFEGNKNIRKFLEICKKLSLPFVMRIGPWCHGEVRNGGFPDWLEEKTNGVVRTDAYPYLDYVKRFFEKIYNEVKDFLDVVVAIQIENELRNQKNYVIKLKEMLDDLGFCAPYYTFTGWGGADSPESCPESMVLPLYGGYPEAPWLDHIEEYFGCSNFLFSKERDDANIGKDLFDRDGSDNPSQSTSPEGTPFLTCELGGGMQITYHRRPIIPAEDIFSLAICKLGSGANGIGYYVYHGGVNPIGKATLQESRQTGYPNDLPIISYDFQAPLGEAGQIRKSYFLLCALHKFIDSEGEKLAEMTANFPDVTPSDFLDTDILRCAVRSNGTSGYLFVSNHYHGGKMKEICENVTIILANGEKVEIPVKIAPSSAGIIPFNYKIGTETVSWITAMPCGQTEKEVCFTAIGGISPQICLDGNSVVPIENGMTLGGKRIVLEKLKFPTPQNGEEIILSAPRISSDKSFFSHIVNFDATIPEFGNVYEYDFKIENTTEYLVIEARGNIGALYCEDRLISDSYLCGNAWAVDVRRFDSASKFTLKILPLTENDKKKIYFEYDMPVGSIPPKVYGVEDDVLYI